MLVATARDVSVACGDTADSAKGLPGPGGPRYVAVVGGGFGAERGIYARVEGGALAGGYVAPSGHCLARARIGARDGHVLSRGAHALHTSCAGRDGALPLGRPWQACAPGAPGAVRLVPLVHEQLRLGGALLLGMGHGARAVEAPVWAWLQGSALRLAREPLGPLVAQLELGDYSVVEDEPGAAAFRLAPRAGGAPLCVRCASHADRQLWLASISASLALFGPHAQAHRDDSAPAAAAAAESKAAASGVKHAAARPATAAAAAGQGDPMLEHWRAVKRAKQEEEARLKERQSKELSSMDEQQRAQLLADKKELEAHAIKKERMLKAQMQVFARAAPVARARPPEPPQ
jgi:hypothetical protein